MISQNYLFWHIPSIDINGFKNQNFQIANFIKKPDILMGMKILFPFSKIRQSQDELIKFIYENMQNGRHSVVHAPTGLGKTAAILSIVVPYALENNLKVFFLTSRQTQHKIVTDTLEQIIQEHNLKFGAVSIIGKKWLCLQPNVSKLKSKDFHEYCKALITDHQCNFYENFRKGEGLSKEAAKTLAKLNEQVLITQQLIMEGRQTMICPYELSIASAKNAKVIIGDYGYIFNPSIRDTVLKKLDIELGQCIVVVDEAHNLPKRIKDLSSSYLTSIMVERAIKEAKKFHPEISVFIQQIGDILKDYSAKIQHDTAAFTKDASQGNPYKSPFGNNGSMGGKMGLSNEKYITRKEFYDKINKIKDYDELTSQLLVVGDAVREAQTISYVGSIGGFLEEWIKEDEGFTRIVSVNMFGRDPTISVSYRCLDPSLISHKVFADSHNAILMSGTLSPPEMYKDLLGVENASTKIFQSPFPQENRLSLIIPKTSTKYTERNEAQYQEIAKICSEIINSVPGNSALFFPSYALRDTIGNYIMHKSKKTIFFEEKNMDKAQKEELLEKFRSYRSHGAALLAVVRGSFGEGIDYPGDDLKCVVIVGLPLQKPDLETQALINYYDRRFGKGLTYGYIAPALTETVQSGGRCIRTETDRGAIIFLDERYTNPMYSVWLPKDWKTRTTLNYTAEIEKFFDVAQKKQDE
jgi:DNA excision repair protein ERCC-2